MSPTLLALGTLYAFEKASLLAKELYSIDILADLIASKISIGLYHTAGKGTRLAPLPGAENNNKPGVKIPATILINNQMVPITILEGVVKQTGYYAKSRAGRLSVFWGDQVFIPTAPVEYTVTHHADILCSLGPMLTEAEWIQKGEMMMMIMEMVSQHLYMHGDASSCHCYHFIVIMPCRHHRLIMMSSII
jgi:hypothetical protein